jgi:hypothetical protein
MDFILYPRYSWHNRPHYQWSQSHTSAKLAHQATLPMDFILYPCYSWHNRTHYQWTLSYTPATAGTLGHITKWLKLILLLQLINRLKYQGTLCHSILTVGKPCHTTKGFIPKQMLHLQRGTTSQCNKGLSLTPTTPIAGTTVLSTK